MRRRQNEEEDESVATGTDLEQMIAMLEKAEVDYEKTDSDDEILLIVGDSDTMMYFNEDGDLQRVQ
ncbi:MAG TPA: hypothetical protein DDY18_09370 [Flavobacterium sp.]|jgi:hypothetical protein|nr:hypothetical protein [Flavobacterium sp.]